ncbi:NAD(P)-dependent oxidoreductase [Roseobacter denitrificans]|uniref:2-hydroxy-3-oxopropionate reductase, putative n=1 Tax=Roseobacter denitrificans (strain ATCC 33942 / OCh 114) TaxID=375451 RepID=Q16CB2_ROSDO|nr:NAD(P)-dependent oxidoreductase [Roseobacter denitrificans]ABG30381.1 2-hydroxy-3-oxopropionate reductase, putative [Roseobacter denitrificans OCh 114]AVL53541.1 NAD(P)-dependent oxidoreductase [Roseobacter denitrificans]SFF72133.1 2-hydroxy-3-oxopropionate reductase [Roseobacter denitrificans OCh 114]
MAQSRKITLIGTGLMGVPMARNLLKAGHDVTVWNRTAARAQPLVADGAKLAADAVQAVQGAEFVITMLSDGYATGALVDDPAIQAALSPGAIWIDMSSTKPEHARAQHATLTALGFGHLDAPVSGGTKGAQDATLAIMVGGKAETFEAARAVFEAMGRPVHVGPSGTGQLSKLANQTIVAVTISAVAEAMLLVEQGGADPAAVRAALKGGFADSTILQQHGERMTKGDFEPGGLTKFQIKDLNNTLDEAASLGLTLPATETVRDRFQHFSDAMGGAEKDHSGLYLELKQRNGLAT